MQTYRTETTVSNDGTLTIEGLPFRAGDKVEVIIRGHVPEINKGEHYPLRGKPIRYDSPFESIPEADWEALK